MIEMDIYVNQSLINKQRSDGVIIATPTGSTAYAMSYGCPIVSPNSNVTCIVPIAPHSYCQRSVIVNNTDDILIEINKKSKLNSQVTFDGANNLTIESPDKIVIKRAKRQLMIVHPCDYDYFDALAKKLKYEIKSKLLFFNFPLQSSLLQSPNSVITCDSRVKLYFLDICS